MTLPQASEGSNSLHRNDFCQFFGRGSDECKLQDFAIFRDSGDTLGEEDLALNGAPVPAAVYLHSLASSTLARLDAAAASS